MIREISKKQVLDRIRFENPWWVNETIESDFNDMPRRLYFELFKPLVKKREIKSAVVLMGPRRVKSPIKFCHENDIKTPIVTSIAKEGEIEYADIQFQFLLSSSYAYTIGKNTLERKKSIML